MIPVLFPADATSFETNGIGPLSDAKQCRVTEERNGQYELRMVYPVGGLYFDELSNERIIYAKPSKSKRKQAFTIYSITDDLNGTVEVLARHISYRANYIPVKPFNAIGIEATFKGLKENSLEENPFTFHTDFDNDYSRFDQVEPRSLKAALGGTDGSVLDVFASKGAGEYEWDNFDIRFWMHRGSDKGYTIRHKKNLSEYSRERDSTDIITGCIAYWVDSETDTVYYGDIQYSSLIDEYPVKKTETIDVSDQFETPPTREQLNTYAKAYAEDLSDISENIDITFYDLDDDFELDLCDTVRVYYSIEYNGKVVKVIDFKTKIIKTIWDVLLNRYHSITVGDNKSSFGKTLTNKIETAKNAAMKVVDNKLTSVVHYIDEEVGEAKTSIYRLEGYLESSLLGIDTLYLINNGETPSKEDEEEAIWSPEYPVWEEGKTIWQLTNYRYVNGNERTEPIKVTDDGSTIAILTEYYLSSSIDDQEDGSWSENLPPMVPGYYLWYRFKYILDEDVNFSDPILSPNNIYNSTIETGTKIQQNADNIVLEANERRQSDLLESEAREQAVAQIIENNSKIEANVEAISASVSQLIKDGGTLSQIQSQLQVNINGVDAIWKSVSELGDFKETQSNYLRWIGSKSTLELGSDKLSTHTEITPNGFAVVDNGTQVVLISDKKQFVQTGAFEVGTGQGSYAKIGRYKWVDEGNSGFSLIYTG